MRLPLLATFLFVCLIVVAHVASADEHDIEVLTKVIEEQPSTRIVGGQLRNVRSVLVRDTSGHSFRDIAELVDAVVVERRREDLDHRGDVMDVTQLPIDVPLTSGGDRAPIPPAAAPWHPLQRQGGNHPEQPEPAANGKGRNFVDHMRDRNHENVPSDLRESAMRHMAEQHKAMQEHFKDMEEQRERMRQYMLEAKRKMYHSHKHKHEL